MTGSLIWEQNISKHQDDLGGFFGPSSLTLSVLTISEPLNMTGDFDNDGKPEILLFYTYSYFTQDLQPGVKGNVAVLKGSNGQHLSPQYTSGWWEVFDYVGVFASPIGYAIWDYNGDSFIDAQLYAILPTTSVPILRVIDLKAKQELFQTNNTDFGSSSQAWIGFVSMPVMRTDGSVLGDLDGDGWWDVVFYNMGGIGDQGARFGAFHAYAGGVQAKKGGRMWLAVGAGTIWRHRRGRSAGYLCQSYVRL